MARGSNKTRTTGSNRAHTRASPRKPSSSKGTKRLSTVGTTRTVRVKGGDRPTRAGAAARSSRPRAVSGTRQSGSGRRRRSGFSPSTTVTSGRLIPGAARPVKPLKPKSSTPRKNSAVKKPRVRKLERRVNKLENQLQRSRKRNSPGRKQRTGASSGTPSKKGVVKNPSFESLHPRAPKGQTAGGRFAPKPGGSKKERQRRRLHHQINVVKHTAPSLAGVLKHTSPPKPPIRRQLPGAYTKRI